jgi:hypothetical protein
MGCGARARVVLQSARLWLRDLTDAKNRARIGYGFVVITEPSPINLFPDMRRRR